MFMDDDDQDPTPADEGKFIPNSELLQWFKEMQKKHPKHPQIYLPIDTLFGTYTEQHGLGQKLMTYFDDDPNKPMKCEVLGSKWNHERTYPGMIPMNAFSKEPLYVIKMGGQISQIVWTSAHEEAGWKRGWDVPPLSSGIEETERMQLPQGQQRYNGIRPNNIMLQNRVSWKDYPDATEFGWVFTGSSDVTEFFEKDGIKLDWYFTTATVKTAMDHPTQGKTQLFRRQVDAGLYRKILENPRIHTDQGYQRRRNDPKRNNR